MLSCQVLASHAEAIQAPEHRDGHMLGIEKLLGQMDQLSES